MQKYKLNTDILENTSLMVYLRNYNNQGDFPAIVPTGPLTVDEFENKLKTLLEAADYKKSTRRRNVHKSIRIDELFDFNTDKQIEINTQYLLDDPLAAAALLDILKSDTDQVITAPMGMGKSYSILKLCAEKKVKIIFAVPLVVNVEQFYEETKRLKYVTAKRQKDKYSTFKRNAKSKRVIICTYNAVEKIYEDILKTGAKDWTLIIDEAHNLVSQSGFRATTMRKMITYGSHFSKMIFVTGTPEVLITPLRTHLNNKLTINLFSRRVNTYVKGEFTTLYTCEKDIDKHILNHLNANQSDGLKIIIQENRARLRELEKLIIESGLANQNELKILDREQKDSEHWDELVKNEKIAESVKYLLSTSVISDGCNIKNENVRALYAIEWRDLIKLKQMLSRLRDADDDIKYFDFLTLEFAAQNDETLNEPDNEFNQDVNNLELLERLLSLVLDSSDVVMDYNSFFQDGSLYGINRTIKRDYFSIYNNICVRKIFEKLYRNPAARHLFIKSHFNLDPDRVQLDELNKLSKKEDEEFAKLIFRSLSDSYSTMLQALAGNHKIIIKSYSDYKLGKSIDDNLESLFSINLNTILIYWFDQLVKVGISVKSTIKILELIKDICIVKYLENENSTRQKLLANLPQVVEQIICMKLYRQITANRSTRVNEFPKRIVQEINSNLYKNGVFIITSEITARLGDDISSQQVNAVINYIFKGDKLNRAERRFKPTGLKNLTDVFGNAGIPLTDQDKKDLQDTGLL